MRAYIVRQGEHLTGIAARLGFDPEEIWNHERNRDLRERRGDPHVLAPNDVLFVPNAPAVPQRINPRRTNQYRALMPTVHLDLVLGAGSAEPLANERYEIQGLAEPIQGTSDGEGRISVDIPAQVREVRLFLPDRGSSSILRIGNLDPVDSISGVRARLVSLGYLPPDDWGDLDEETSIAPEVVARELASAVRRFQRDRGLEQTGQLDATTRDALRDAHGA